MYKKILLVLVTLFVISCDSKEIKFIKQGSLTVLPDVTIEELFDVCSGYSTNWEFFIADDGYDYVNATYYNDDAQELLFQFKILDDENFELSVLEIDGEPYYGSYAANQLKRAYNSIINEY